MIYDKDQISGDDLVGCVTVSLGELGDDGSFNGWKQINRPPRGNFPAFATKNNGDIKLKIKMTYQESAKTTVPEPESSHGESEILPSPKGPEFILAAEGPNWAMTVSDHLSALENGTCVPSSGIVLPAQSEAELESIPRNLLRAVEASNSAPLVSLVRPQAPEADRGAEHHGFSGNISIAATDVVFA